MLGMRMPNMRFPQLQPLTDEEVKQVVGFPLWKRYVTFALIFGTRKQSSAQVILIANFFIFHSYVRWTRRMHMTHMRNPCFPKYGQCLMALKLNRL